MHGVVSPKHALIDHKIMGDHRAAWFRLNPIGCRSVSPLRASTQNEVNVMFM